ncbi:hypothetical protein G9A89_014970 [Geosiphon pyriformis]|nr:hypothetical protein G9A89_014970 [Geosiphon pyriformis]
MSFYQKEGKFFSRRVNFSAMATVSVKNEVTERFYDGPMTRKRTRAHLKVELEEPQFPSEQPVKIKASDALSINTIKKQRSTKKMTRTQLTTKMVPSEPSNWKEVLESLKKYRIGITAPVDTMGCERLADPVSEIVTPQISRFQTLVALMLSSQTKDNVTAQAVHNLKERLPGGLTIQSVIDADKGLFDDCISKVGFHNQKTGYIKKTAVICKEKYNEDIPDTVEGLMSLPGVGPKMAYLCMQCAWEKNAGIGVDVHVHRISNRLGWCKTEKAGPEATRMALESWLPQEYWTEINALLVGFGQTKCFSRNPKCSECPVSSLCPSAVVTKKSAVKANKKTKSETSFLTS